MAFYRPLPETLEAFQWFKNGDHPQDGGFPTLRNGLVVTRWTTLTHATLQVEDVCPVCSRTYGAHGVVVHSSEWVCPGDYVVTIYDPVDLKRRAAAALAGKVINRRSPKVIGYRVAKRAEFESRYEPLPASITDADKP